MTDWGWGKVEGEERRGNWRRRAEKRKKQERGKGLGRLGWRRGRNQLTY